MDFGGIADDFFVNLNLQTTLELPSGRETVLHFCEAVRKQFPLMTSFYRRESGEYALEGDRDSGTYPWMELQQHRLSAGYFNPPQLEDAYELLRWLLDRSIYFLGVGGLDIECLDVLFGFNLDFQGNRDEIVSQALLGGSPLSALVSEGLFRPLEFEPSMVVALDEGCYLQARLNVETRSSSFQVRTGQYDSEPISVYFTIRRYPEPGRLMKGEEGFIEQAEMCEDIASRIVLPSVVYPISAAIAAAQ